MAGVYIAGEIVVLEGVFTEAESGVAADPGSLTVTVVRPDGTTFEADAALLTTTPDAAGDWRATFTADAPGIWQYRVVGTEGVEAIAQGSLYVRRSVLTEEGS